MPEILPSKPLSPEELDQLQQLLARYLWNGVADVVNCSINVLIDELRKRYPTIADRITALSGNNRSISGRIEDKTIEDKTKAKA